jgi:hypothetical protein
LIAALFCPPTEQGRASPRQDGSKKIGMTPKAFLAAAAAAAIAVGLALPVPHRSEAAAAKPQIPTFEVGR